MISEIIKKIMEFLPKESQMWIYPILLAVFCYKPFSDFVGDLKKKKANRLKEALTEGNDYLDEDSKKFIQSNLSEYYFKQAVGLDITQDFRKALMKLYQKDNCPVSWQHFRRVIYYMKYDNNEIIGVKIPIIIEIIGFLCASFGIALAVKTILLYHKYIINNKFNDISDLIVFLLLMAVCTIFALVSMAFIVRPYLIYKSAKFVNRHAQKDNIKYKPTCWYEKSIRDNDGISERSWIQWLKDKWRLLRWLYQIMVLILAYVILYFF